MAKLKFEDYKAPWEKDLKEGEEPPVLDHDEIKRLLFNQLNDKVGDKEKLQAKIDEVTAERDTFKSQVEAKAREGETTEARLTRERDEALEKARKAGETSIETLRLRVALDKGLTKTQAKRLVGTTEAELEADADELLAEWGPTSSDDKDRGEGNDDLLRQLPAVAPRSAGDPTPTASALDVDKAADAYMNGRSILG